MFGSIKDTTRFKPYFKNSVEFNAGYFQNEKYKATHGYNFGSNLLGHIHLLPQLAVGAGLGLQIDNNNIVAPITLDIRTSLNKPISPALNLAVGYVLVLGSSYSYAGSATGLIIAPSVGVRVKRKHNNNFFVGIGYRKQNLTAKGLNNFSDCGNNPICTYQWRTNVFTANISFSF